MAFEIQSYNENFLKSQEEIGNKILGKWLFAGQTSADNLKQAYSQEGFDPNTRLYALKGGEVVGFLTAAVQPDVEGQPKSARLEFPILLSEHKELCEPLFAKAIEVLRQKGVEQVLTRVSRYWGDTTELSKKYGYEVQNVIQYSSSGVPDIAAVNTSDVSDFTEDDIEQSVQLLIRFYELGEEQADGLRNQFKTLDTLVGEVVSHVVIHEGEKIVARLLSYKQQKDDDTILVGIPAVDDTKHLTKIIAKTAEKLKGRSEKVVFNLSGKAVEFREQLDAVGMNFEPSLEMHVRTL